MRMQKGHMEIKRQWKSLALSFHLLVSGGLNTGHLVQQQVSSPVNPSPQLGRSFVLPTPVVLVQCRGGGGEADWFSWRVQSFALGMNMVTGHIRCLPEFWAPFTCPLYSTWAPSLQNGCLFGVSLLKSNPFEKVPQICQAGLSPVGSQDQTLVSVL